MPNEDFCTALTAKIALLEQKKNEIAAVIDQLKEARARLVGIPSWVEAILEDCPEESETPQLGEEETPAKSHFAKIADFLRSVVGPQTIGQIVDGTGIPRGSISTVLYRTHPGEFLQSRTEGPTRAKGWSLRGARLPDQAVADEIPF